jgi:hypothetical protein
VRYAPLVFAAFALCLLLGFPLSDTDIWWHLAAGREMVSTGTWLWEDPFCSSSLGSPWIDLHWGFQLLLLAVHALSGNIGLWVLRILLVVATVAIALRGRLAWETASLACLIVFVSRTFLDLRPLLPTMICLGLLWSLLEAPRTRWNLSWILLLQVVMVNLQGLFLLGPLVALAHAAGRFLEEGRKPALRDAWIPVALLAASLVNPWGTGAFELATRVAERIVPVAENPYSWQISENLPLLDWLRESPLRLLGLSWWALGIAWLWRSGPGAAGRALLLGGMAILALMAVRNLPLLALASFLCVRPRPAATRWIGFAATAAMLALSTTTALSDRRWDLPGGVVSPLQSPPERMRQILSQRPTPVFHELRVGGWLTWSVPRDRLCWADTRLVLHDGAFLESLLETLDHPERFEAWSLRHGFSHALLPVSIWPRNRPLVAHLLRSEQWRVEDTDGSWILFSRTQAPIVASGKADQDKPDPMDPAVVEGRIRERFGANPLLEELVRREWLRVLAEAGGSP